MTKLGILVVVLGVLNIAVAAWTYLGTCMIWADTHAMMSGKYRQLWVDGALNVDKLAEKFGPAARNDPSVSFDHLTGYESDLRARLSMSTSTAIALQGVLLIVLGIIFGRGRTELSKPDLHGLESAC